MINIVFMATPDIATESLEYLINRNDINVLAVVTQADKPKGRGNRIEFSPVKTCALKHNIAVFQPISFRKDEKLIGHLRELNPDFFVTFAYGQILSQEILDIPKYSTINLHASLLPRYRGANPIQRAIANGDTTTGITTMITVLELDAGDMCLSETIDITENMTACELTLEIKQKSPELIYKTLTGLVSGEITPQKQDIAKVTFAPKFTKEDGLIDWNSSAAEIHNRIRGLQPWPGCYTFFDGKMLKIIESRLTGIKTSFCPATMVGKAKEGIEVATGDNTILITKVQPAGKSQMRSLDWLNGSKMSAGDKFEQQIMQQV